MKNAKMHTLKGKGNMKKTVIIGYEKGVPQSKEGEDVTPSYSRSGGKVIKIEDRFFVPKIDTQFPAMWFDSLNEAWDYCESAYYSYN